MLEQRWCNERKAIVVAEDTQTPGCSNHYPHYCMVGLACGHSLGIHFSLGLDRTQWLQQYFHCHRLCIYTTKNYENYNIPARKNAVGLVATAHYSSSACCWRIFIQLHD